MNKSEVLMMRDGQEQNMNSAAGKVIGRRRVLKQVGLGAALLASELPERWQMPVVRAVVLPAHAGTTTRLTFGNQRIPPQSYSPGADVPDLVLPTATGSTRITYSLAPSLRPIGLAFDPVTRTISTISDTIASVLSVATYTYTATDYHDGTTTALTFTISVMLAVTKSLNLRVGDDTGDEPLPLTARTTTVTNNRVEGVFEADSTDSGASLEQRVTDLLFPRAFAQTVSARVTGGTFSGTIENGIAVGTGNINLSINDQACPYPVRFVFRVTAGGESEIAFSYGGAQFASTCNGIVVAAGDGYVSLPSETELKARPATQAFDEFNAIDVSQPLPDPDTVDSLVPPPVTPDDTGDVGPLIDTVNPQTYYTGVAIEPLILPEAVSEAGDCSYTLSPAALPDGLEYSHGLSSYEGLEPVYGDDGEIISYTLSPVLPAGVTLSPDQLNISRERHIIGTPITPSPATRYTWTAIDQNGRRATASFTIAVVQTTLVPRFEVVRGDGTVVTTIPAGVPFYIRGRVEPPVSPPELLRELNGDVVFTITMSGASGSTLPQDMTLTLSLPRATPDGQSVQDSVASPDISRGNFYRFSNTGSVQTLTFTTEVMTTIPGVTLDSTATTITSQLTGTVPTTVPTIGFASFASSVREDAGLVKIPLSWSGTDVPASGISLTLTADATGDDGDDIHAIRLVDASGDVINHQVNILENPRRIERVPVRTTTITIPGGRPPSGDFVSVLVVADGRVTADRTVMLTLSVATASPTWALSSTTTHTLTVEDIGTGVIDSGGEGVIRLGIGGRSFKTRTRKEGQQFPLQVSLLRHEWHQDFTNDDNPSFTTFPVPITVSISVAYSSGATAADLQGVPSTLTIPAGESSVTSSPITVRDDSIFESTEFFTFTATPPKNINGLKQLSDSAIVDVSASDSEARLALIIERASTPLREGDTFHLLFFLQQDGRTVTAPEDIGIAVSISNSGIPGHATQEDISAITDVLGANNSLTLNKDETSARAGPFTLFRDNLREAPEILSIGGSTSSYGSVYQNLPIGGAEVTVDDKIGVIGGSPGGLDRVDIMDDGDGTILSSSTRSNTVAAGTNVKIRVHLLLAAVADRTILFSTYPAGIIGLPASITINKGKTSADTSSFTLPAGIRTITAAGDASVGDDVGDVTVRVGDRPDGTQVRPLAGGAQQITGKPGGVPAIYPPNDSAGVNVPILIYDPRDGATVTKVVVAVDFQHPDSQTLIVTLTSPDGSMVTLLDKLSYTGGTEATTCWSGTADGETRWGATLTFDENAATEFAATAAICRPGGAGPRRVTGTYSTPGNVLNNFNGKPTNGTWTLNFSDPDVGAASNRRALDSATLIITSTA